MTEISDAPAKLWGVIVAYGLEEEFERDLLGRIKSKRTKRYLSAKASPELLQFLASANSTLLSAQTGAAGAMTAARDGFRQNLLRRTSAD